MFLFLKEQYGSNVMSIINFKCCMGHTIEFQNQPNIDGHLEYKGGNLEGEKGLTTGKIKLDPF